MTFDAILSALAQGRRSKGVPVRSEDDVIAVQKKFRKWLRQQAG